MNEHELLAEIKEGKKLLVYRSVKDHKMAVLISVAFIALTAIAIFNRLFTSFPLLCMADVILKAVIEVGLWCVLALLVITVAYFTFFCRYSDPIAILDRDGIWMRHFGFISWKNITGGKLFSLKDQSFVGFDLRDEKVVRKTADLVGKIRMTLPRPQGLPCVTLSNTNVPLELIMMAVRYYLGC